MSEQPSKKVKKTRGKKNAIVLVVLLLLFVGIPLAFLLYQSQQSGMTIQEVLSRKTRTSETEDAGSSSVISELDTIYFLDKNFIGFEFNDQPQISNLLAVDLDRDQLMDVLVCDSKSHSVSWIRQFPEGTFNETILADELIAPSHVQAYDFDHDGDLDLLVGVLGMLFPNNDKIGSIVLLENDGNHHFRKHVVAEKIARVSDVRAGDLDGDGDSDLAVAQFGYDDGETRWVENLGDWKFKSHNLQNFSGPINVELHDMDEDGDLDIISLVSQEWEEIYCFVNDGKGNFTPKLLWGSNNEDYGSSGISIVDINQDGKKDILYTNGDAFDYVPPVPRPWHGVQWLENNGDLTFKFHRICKFPGAFSARATDVDGDKDMDIFVISGFNFWDKPDAASFMWLENNGQEEFTQHYIANDPTHLLTLETADFNNDGRPDFVTGGMHVYPPFDRMARITLWLNNGEIDNK